jgi:hypothetical protein
MKNIVILTLFFLLFSGCTPYKVLAVYNTPKIIVSYEDIVHSCHLTIGKNASFSTKEIEEIFNLLIIISHDPEVKDLRILVKLDSLSLFKNEKGLICASMGIVNGMTSGYGNNLYFNHRSDGKYELVDIKSWVS